MKQFIIKCVSGAILLLMIDLAVGFTHDRVFTDLPDTTSMWSTIYQSLFKKCPEVVILGPSTANHNYNPQLLTDSLKMETYNAGLDAHDIVYCDVVLNSMLDRTDVKEVILDVGESQLDGKWINSSIADTKIYYKRSPEVTKYYDNETDWQQRLKLRSNLYRYNQSCYNLVHILLNRPDTLNGFRPLVGQNADFIRKESYQFSIDSTELRHLENIVATCKNRGVNLLFVQSPRETNNIAFNNWITAFSKSKGVPLYNEDANGFWESHHELFYDGAHLNSEGADEFSRKIASFVHNKNIKSYFNESSSNNI